MSEAWLCDDTNLKRKVVVKTLKPGMAPAKLLDELAALSAIRSPHVVQVLDVIYDSAGEITGFVEEYIDGPALTCSPVTGTEPALKLLYPIACGIADIHSQGRLHRDIKPENMKFDKEGVLKIFDFGLAKLETTPGTSVLYYSAGFTAPEAFKKSPSGVHEFSKALDVFAFGATAWWLLNEGKLPPEFSEIPARIPNPAPDFSTLSAGLPPAVCSLLNRTLSLSPSHRPEMRDVKALIARHLLRDRHRMLITYQQRDYVLDSNNRTTSLVYGVSGISIEYNGLDFKVTKVTGSVLINNITATVGTTLTGAAVIVLNTPTGRVSITADVSHPEVTA